MSAEKSIRIIFNNFFKVIFINFHIYFLHIYSSLLNNLYNNFPSLSDFNIVKLTESIDYISTSLTIENALLKQIRIDSIPNINADKLSFLANQASFTPNKKSVLTGTYLTLRAQVAFKNQFPSHITDYQLIVDSALFTSFTGLSSQKETFAFKTKSLEEYAVLIFELTNYTGKEVIQLLNKDDKVIKQQVATDAKVKFEHIKPDTYYARLFIDENGNGQWDTGNYKEKRQAEKIYYYPYDMQLRAFWDVEEVWNIYELPILEQKPKELIKTETKK